MQDFAESYSFAKAACDKNDFDLFDVTQDDRPALTKSAAENLLVFANESDGKTEVPSLVCRYDAEGSIHYLMGHDDEDRGPLVIPMDKDFELKVYLMFSSLLSFVNCHRCAGAWHWDTNPCQRHQPFTPRPG